MRNAFLADLAERIAARSGTGILRVGINGVDGSGKTSLADELSPLVTDASGLPVIRSSIDGFHNPRAIRYTRGRASALGFYADSFNLPLFRAALLDPLSPGGTRRYRSAAFDHRIDAAVELPEAMAPEPAILIVDGIFLLRPELSGYWDLSIFLDVPFAESFRRMSLRDNCSPDPEDKDNLRYRDGQELYFAECQPQARADILVDYADLSAPALRRS